MFQVPSLVLLPSTGVRIGEVAEPDLQNLGVGSRELESNFVYIIIRESAQVHP